MVKIAAVFMLAALAGCQTGSGTFCDIAKPHRFTSGTLSAMTDGEVKQELAHNRTGQKLCGWRP